MITLRNILSSTLLLAALLLSSVAQPMKRTNDGSDNNEREHKRQKVNEEIMITLKSDDHVVKIAKSSAMHSVTLKNMIDDCGPDTDFSEVSFPMPNMSQATLKHVVDCLNIIKKNNPDYDATRAGLVIYVRHLHKDELETLRMAANFLDLDLLIDVLKSAGTEWVNIFDAPAKQSVEQKHTIATHTSTGPIKLSWQNAGQDQWIEIPRKLAQHSGMLQEVMSMDSGYSIPVLNASQTTLEHIVACLNIIDDNENQNNQLKSIDENFKTEALSFAHLDSQLWNELFKSIGSIKAANKSNLSAELANYIKDMSHKKLCHLMNAANDLNIVPLMDVCIKKCVEFYSSNQALNDFKEFAFVGGFPELPFDLSNQCAQQLSYFPEVKKWLLKPTTLVGHNDSITSVCFSPDDTTLASVSYDNTIKIWNLAQGQWQCTQTLNGHNNWVKTVCFSPDGTTLVSGSSDNTIKIWNLAMGQWQCTQTLNGHNDSITSVCFSPEGTTLASGSYDHTIKIWNLAQGQWQCTQTLNGHNYWVNSVCFSPDGTTLVSGSSDNTVKIWNLATGQWQCTQTLNEHNNWVNSICFNPEGTTLASGSYDHTIKIWNLAQGQWQCTQTLNGHNTWVNSICFNPDGTILASGSNDNTIKFWNVAMGQCTETLSGLDSEIWSVCFSPDGKTLVFGSDDNTVKIWNLVKRQIIQHLLTRIMTLEQAIFLKLVHQAHEAQNVLDLTKDNHKHLLEIFQTLPKELRKLLLEKQFVKIQS